MPEGESSSVDRHQACRVGQADVRIVALDGQGREHRCRRPVRAGGAEHGHPPGTVRQIGELSAVHISQPVRNGQHSRQRRRSSPLRSGQRAPALQQREWIPVCLVDQPLDHAVGESRPQQIARRVGRQAVDRDDVEPVQWHAQRNPDAVGQHHGDAVVHKPTGREHQRLSRLHVDPLHIVNRYQHRAVGRCC
jgi:hypothetical protein